MSAIFASVGGESLTADTLRSAIAAMSGRGSEDVDVSCLERAGLAAGRFHWETAAFAPGTALLDDGVRVVVADATLYYRDALTRAIRDATAARPFEIGESVCHLLLAAYRAWGADCARHLEGDFAFAIWDREASTLVCARDFVGSRPLYYGRAGDALIVGSHAGVVARHTPHAGALNVPAIGESLAGLFNVGDDTSFLGVSTISAGHTLTFTRAGNPTIAAHWTAPTIDSAGASSFEQGAEELRSLLTDAVDQRLLDGGTTALWLSGGWDSSAILACATLALERRHGGRTLSLVSMSYPVGNRGREDEAILSVTERFGRAVTWCSSESVPLLPPDPAREAAQRDLPFAHAFEMWSRAMIAKSQESGARVVLTGTGGDELFSGTNLYLCDLLRSGSFGTLALEWYRQRGRTLRGFGKRVVQPLLDARRGRADLRAGGPLEQRIPTWMSADFVRTHRLLERERLAAPYGLYRSLSDMEMHWGVTSPMHPRIRSTLASVQLQAGVGHRSPFFDGRLVRFAMGRPRDERVSARETKRLLRRAMRGLLPDAFLAPRSHRTGVTSEYMRVEMQGPARAALTEGIERSVLAELGIVDADRVKRDWQEFLQTGNTFGLRFYELYQTEMWVRARLDSGSARSVASHGDLLSLAAS